jgi:tryptophanase
MPKGLGAQPVSLALIQAVRQLCNRFHKPLYIHACRLADNAWLVKQREIPDMAVKDITRNILALPCTRWMHHECKKGWNVSNIGGFLALRDSDLAQMCRSLLVVTEGFPTYGGPRGARPGEHRSGCL